MLLFNHSCGVLLLDAGCMLAENSKVRTNLSRKCFHVISWKGARKGLDSYCSMHLYTTGPARQSLPVHFEKNI